MKSIRLLLTGLIFLGFFACSNENEIEIPEPQGDLKNAISFNIGFDNRLKVSTDADFKSQFEDGDEIGLFIIKSGAAIKPSGNFEDNRKLVYNNGEWTLDGSKIYFPVDGSSLSFYAYYPYTDNVDPTNMTFGVEEDQSQESGYNKSDLLLAQAKDQLKATITLQFAHALSLIQVEVNKGANMVSFDNSLTVSLLNCFPAASVNLENGVATVKPSDAKPIVMHRVETGQSATKYNYRALVPAQTIAADTELFFFVQETTGKEINNNYISETAITLTAAKVSKWKIALDGEALPEHNYAVGDVYPFMGTPLGIVFEISNDGKNGKVVALKEKAARWGTQGKDESIDGIALIRDADNGKEATQNMVKARKNSSNFAGDYAAFHWIYTEMNENDDTGIWYMPAKNELRSLYAAISGLTYEDIKTSWLDANAMPGFDSQACIAARTAFNEKIKAAGGTAFGVDVGQYWSVTEINTNSAWSVKIDTGILQNSKRKDDSWGRTRPIMEF